MARIGFRGSWLGALAALALLGAYARDESDDPEVSPRSDLRDRAARHPPIAAWLRGAERAPAVAVGSGDDAHYRVTSTPQPARQSTAPRLPGAAASGTWRSTDRGTTVEISSTDPGTWRAGTTGRGLSVTVRRAGSTGSRAELDSGAVWIRDASPGVDAVFLPAEKGVEELLFVREPGVELGYDFELPAGWWLRRSNDAAPSTVEILRPSGVAALRVVVNEAWDAEGRHLAPAVTVDRNRLRISIAPEAKLPVVVDPMWTSSGPMNFGRTAHTATLLPNGKVLFAGGNADTAELYDPVTGTFTQTGAKMRAARRSHTATCLSDGTVLLAGGSGPHESALRSTEIYDPRSDGFKRGPTLDVPRSAHTATSLPGGDVLLVGGLDASAARYDRASHVFYPAGDTALPASPTYPTFHTAVRLQDGRVLLRGGDVAQIYDSWTGTLLPGVVLPTERFRHSATLLGDGRVLFAAGCDCPDCENATTESETSEDYAPPLFRTAEVYDPLTGSIASGVLAERRAGHSAALLPGDEVLLTGCSPPRAHWLSCLTSAEIYDPSSGKTSDSPSALHAQNGPTSTILADGTVLVAGDVADIYVKKVEWRPTEKDLDEFFYVALPLLSGKVLLATEGRSRLYDPSTDTLLGHVPGSEAIHPHFAVTLHDGRALVTSSSNDEIMIYDPDIGPLGSWAPAGKVSTRRAKSTATVLHDGKVLLAGGGDMDGPSEDPAPSSAADLYDPDLGTITPTKPMNYPRFDPATIRLADGHVLIAGGRTIEGGEATAELYLPEEGRFRNTTRMKGSMEWPRATMLPNGTVLLRGKSFGQIFDPDSESESFIYSTAAIPPDWYKTAVTPSGLVLLFGANNVVAYDYRTDSAETIRPGLDPYRIVGAVLLAPSGDVLITSKHLSQGNVDFTWQALTWHDAAAPDAALRPALSKAPSEVTIGDTVKVNGARLTGVSEASSGTTGSSPSDHPVSVWLPWPYGTPSYGTLTEWSPSEVTWTVPHTSYPGLGLLFVVTNGTSSNGLPVIIHAGEVGARCAHDLGCVRGVCIDGVCCDGKCSGCQSCSEAMTGLEEGQCGPRMNPRTAAAPCCDGDHTLRAREAEQDKDCGAYRCPAGEVKCLTECFSNADCAPGNACSAVPATTSASATSTTRRRCESALAERADSGCILSVTGRTGGGTAWLLVLTAVLGARRRRRCPSS